jgi:hypothetical protein
MGATSAALVLTALLTAPLPAAGIIKGCLPITMDDVSTFDRPRFENFPGTARFTGIRAPPVFPPHSLARRFRTELRTQARTGPGFAGALTIVGWGCGSSCLQFAIIDAKKGTVNFPTDIPTVSGVYVGGDTGPSQKYWGLQYFKSSRLLALIGTIGDDGATTGVWYFEWTGISLKPLLWYKSEKKWCETAK